jgi:hypothetical protein
LGVGFLLHGCGVREYGAAEENERKGEFHSWFEKDGFSLVES